MTNMRARACNSRGLVNAAKSLGSSLTHRVPRKGGSVFCVSQMPAAKVATGDLQRDYVRHRPNVEAIVRCRCPARSLVFGVGRALGCPIKNAVHDMYEPASG